MITMNPIKTTGVPWGTKWDSMWLRFFNQPNKLTDNHLTNAKGRVKTKWEVKENTWGKRAVKFIKKIKINKTRIEVSSLFFVFLKLKDTSFNRNLESFWILFKCEGLENHKCWGIIKIISKPVNQHKLRDDEEGSKTENRLFIIVFSFFLVSKKKQGRDISTIFITKIKKKTRKIQFIGLICGILGVFFNFDIVMLLTNSTQF